MRTLLGAMLVLAGATPAGGQTCMGAASFRERAFQFLGTAGLSDSRRSYEEGFAVGGAHTFGHIALGTNRFDDFPGSSFVGSSYHGVAFTAGGGGGYQVALGPVFLCPATSVKLFVGPSELGVSNLRYSEADLAVGVALGVVAARASRTEVIPTASLALVNAHTRFSDPYGNAAAGWNSYGLVAAGIGLVFGGELSIVPAVAVPFGWKGASTTVGLTISFNFGRRDPGT